MWALLSLCTSPSWYTLSTLHSLSRAGPEFWVMGTMLPSPFSSSSHQVCWMGLNEDSLRTILLRNDGIFFRYLLVFLYIRYL